MYVFGNKAGVREATELQINIKGSPILTLSNQDCLPSNNYVKQIEKMLTERQCFIQVFLLRNIEEFNLVEGKLWQKVKTDGDRIKEIVNDNINILKKKMKEKQLLSILIN